RAGELLELPRPRDRVIADDPDAAPLPGCGLDSVRMDEPASPADDAGELAERVSTGEGKHRVETLRGEPPRGSGEVPPFPVHCLLGAQPADERDSVLSRSGGEHARSAEPGELDGD